MTLLGAYHDGYIEFVYPVVYACHIDIPTRLTVTGIGGTTSSASTNVVE